MCNFRRRCENRLSMKNRLAVPDALRSGFTRLISAGALPVLVALALAGAASAAQSAPQSAGTPQTAVFAGGCFWGVDGVFKHVKGVTRVVSGYAGGEAPTAHYEVVSTGNTGHAESVEVTYDPSQLSYDDLLKVFFLVAHDPTELNRQGPDEGTQYRSAIFFADAQQRKLADDYIAKLKREKTFSDPIVTQVVPLKAFYPAEDYHQNYLERHPDNPYIAINDLPKIESLREKFPNLYKP